MPWEVFQDTLHDAVQRADDIWPDDPQYTWHGLSVYAIDGSKFTLPQRSYEGLLQLACAIICWRQTIPIYG